jgi:hypothetical protein
MGRMVTQGEKLINGKKGHVRRKVDQREEWSHKEKSRPMGRKVI